MPMSLLRVPPFPGSVPQSLAVRSSAPASLSDSALDEIVQSIAQSRAAGTFWGSQPEFPQTPYVLVRTADPLAGIRLAEDPSRPVVVWASSVNSRKAVKAQFHVVSGRIDPWHLLQGASEAIIDADDELAAIAAIAGVPVRCVGEGAFKTAGQGRAGLLQAMRGPCLGGSAYIDPFTGDPISLAQAVELCAFWRRLIDGNRPTKAALGFASWKQPTVAPLLWAGRCSAPFVSRLQGLNPGDEVAIWKSRVSERQLAALTQFRTIEVEDGFIRSIGLGADCVPPLSIIVDRSGVYFDPQQPSDLEQLLEDGNFSPDLLDRARRIRYSIVESGISKYEAGGAPQEGQSGERRHLLVVGQVEDDRSVRCGGGAVQTNLELLRRVRREAPDAFISYRPHPDVQAGHRVGRVPEGALASLADQLVQSGSISSWIDTADEVHVNTSLAGFEALLRGKPVTTHGVPFYAGWGLTRDLGDVPARRTARRSLDELVAATLLQYPRYLDPLTGLPCPAETLVSRIAAGGVPQGRGILVRLRQFQGQWKRRTSLLRTRVFK